MHTRHDDRWRVGSAQSVRAPVLSGFKPRSGRVLPVPARPYASRSLGLSRPSLRSHATLTAPSVLVLLSVQALRAVGFGDKTDHGPSQPNSTFRVFIFVMPCGVLPPPPVESGRVEACQARSLQHISKYTLRGHTSRGSCVDNQQPS